MKLINPVPPDAPYLYHYTSADIALNHILKNGTLKLNSFSEVNDPREKKEWDISPIVSVDKNLSLEEYDEIARDISSILKNNAKIVCFCRDKDASIGKWQPQALLDRGFAKPSMWHHYGGKHSGLCLMFDKNKLSESIGKQLDKNYLVSGKVSYSNEGILPKFANDPFIINLTKANNNESYLTAIECHHTNWHSKLFLQKLIDWENEDEYRWIYRDINSHPVYVNFEDALEAIVIGEHFSDTHYENILRYCVKYHADVAKLNWHNGYPKIEHPGQPYISHKHLV